MKKSTLFASVAVLALVYGAPVVHAQSYGAGSGIVLADHSMRTSKLIGMQVLNDQDQTVGTVADVLVKEKAEPTVILSVGDYVGGGAKLVAAPLSHIKIEGAKVMMPGATKAMVSSMAAYTGFTAAGG